jgi:hypothetical protein
MRITLQGQRLAATFLRKARAPRIRHPDLYRAQAGGTQGIAMALYSLGCTCSHLKTSIKKCYMQRMVAWLAVTCNTLEKRLMSIFSRFIDISCGCVDGADMYRKRDFLITSLATCSKSGDFLSHPNHIEDKLDMVSQHHNSPLNA